MDREAFVLWNGESFSAWDVQFGSRKERQETIPYIHTVESAKVSFCTAPGSVHVGQWGQLSWGDLFHNVKVSFVELAEGHVIIRRDATREFGCRYWKVLTQFSYSRAFRTGLYQRR